MSFINHGSGWRYDLLKVKIWSEYIAWNFEGYSIIYINRKGLNEI